MAKVILKYKKTRHTHPWIRKDEIKEIKGEYAAGDVVHIFNCRNEFIASGYINESSKFLIRIFSDKRQRLDTNFFKTRIYQALQRRGELYRDSNAYRLLFSEADKVPGVIADIYNNIIVIQVNTLGMERAKKHLISALVDTMQPAAIYEKSVAPARKIEGLEPIARWVYGTPQNPVIIKFNGLSFIVNVETGQKTGFFLDQRDNAKLLTKFVKKGDICLDLFCYEGTFTLSFIKAGAAHIDAVDSSKNALNLLQKNLELNKLSAERVTLHPNKAFSFLQNLEHSKSYDLILMDPPAFAHSRKLKGKALSGYKHLIISGLKHIKPNGIFAFSTCSHIIKERDIIRLFQESAQQLKMKTVLVEKGSQPKDHPINKNISETKYLNFLIFQVKK